MYVFTDRVSLCSHCKNRTNLYHTLLHYKFRLMLKVHKHTNTRTAPAFRRYRLTLLLMMMCRSVSSWSGCINANRKAPTPD